MPICLPLTQIGSVTLTLPLTLTLTLPLTLTEPYPPNPSPTSSNPSPEPSPWQQYKVVAVDHKVIDEINILQAVAPQPESSRYPE